MRTRSADTLEGELGIDLGEILELLLLSWKGLTFLARSIVQLVASLQSCLACCLVLLAMAGGFFSGMLTCVFMRDKVH